MFNDIYQKIKNTPKFKKYEEEFSEKFGTDSNPKRRAGRRMFEEFLFSGFEKELMSLYNIESKLVNKIKNFVKEVSKKVVEPYNYNAVSKEIKKIVDNTFKDSEFIATTKKKGYVKVEFQEAFNQNDIAKEIMTNIGTKEGYILTGSIAFSPQGTIYRQIDTIVHDLDFVITVKPEEAKALLLQYYPNSKEAYKFKKDNGQDSSTFIVPPKGHTVANIKRRWNEEKKEFGKKVVSFDILKNGRVVGTYRLIDVKNKEGKIIDSYEVKKGKEAMFVDFFTKVPGRGEPFPYKFIGSDNKEYSILLSKYGDGFKAKLGMSRFKDIWDYNRFIPNEKTEQQKKMQEQLQKGIPRQSIIWFWLREKFEQSFRKFQQQDGRPLDEIKNDESSVRFFSKNILNSLSPEIQIVYNKWFEDKFKQFTIDSEAPQPHDDIKRHWKDVLLHRSIIDQSEKINEGLAPLLEKDILFVSLNSINSRFRKAFGIVTNKQMSELIGYAQSEYTLDEFLYKVNEITGKDFKNDSTRKDAILFYRSVRSSVRTNSKNEKDNYRTYFYFNYTDGELDIKKDINPYNKKSNPTSVRKMLSEAILGNPTVSKLLSSEIKFKWLTGGDLTETTSDGGYWDFYGKTTTQERYKTVTLDELQSLESALLNMKVPHTIAFNRGDRENLAIVEVPKELIDDVKNNGAESFWDSEIVKNNITPEQKDNFLLKNEFKGVFPGGQSLSEVIDEYVLYDDTPKRREGGLEKDIVPAYFNHDSGKIILNKKALKEKFKEKAWRKPKVKYVKPMLKNFTENEWMVFVIGHELGHMEVGKNEHKPGTKEYAKVENSMNEKGFEAVQNYRKQKRIPLKQAANIQAYRAMQQLLESYMNEDAVTVLKRFKVPTTPGITDENMDDIPSRYLNKETATFITNAVLDPDTGRYVGNIQKAYVNVDENIGDSYILDGSTPVSKWVLDKYAERLGYPKGVSMDKNAIWIQDKDLESGDSQSIFYKHQQFQMLPNTAIYENYGRETERLVAIVNKDGNLEDEKGNLIGQISTEDEIKIFSGKFKEKALSGETFKVPGKSVEHIHTSKSRKDQVKHPFQLYNYITDSNILNAFSEEMIPEVSSRLDDIFNLTISKLTTTAKSIESFMVKDSENSMYLDNIQSEMYKLGMGLQSSGLNLIDTLVQSRIGNRALGLHNMLGLNQDCIGNYDSSIGEDEVSVYYKDASDLRRIVATDTAQPLKDIGVSEINNWLSSNEYWTLGTRSPIPHSGGGKMLKIKKVHNLKGQVHINIVTLKKHFEGDGDGDKISLEKLSPKLEEAFKGYYNKLKVKGISLDKYIDKKEKYDLSNKSDLFKLIEAMAYGKSAIAEIANIQFIYGILQTVMTDKFTINGKPIQLRKSNEIIKTDFGFDGTMETLLRTYFQAAVDNSKFLLLKKWDYNQDELLKQLFHSNKKPITNSDWKQIKSDIYRIKQVRTIIRGSAQGKRLSFKETVKLSKEYTDFVNSKRADIGSIFKSTSNNLEAIHPLERIAMLPYKKMQEHIARTGHAFLLNSPFEIDPNFQEYVHLASLVNLHESHVELRADMSKKETVNAESYANKMGSEFYKLFNRDDQNIEYLRNWDKSEDKVNFTIKWDKEFRKLNENERKYATYYFLNGIQKKNPLSGKVSRVKNVKQMPPVSLDFEKFNTLDSSVVRNYFNQYNKLIASPIVAKKNDGTYDKKAYEDLKRKYDDNNQLLTSLDQLEQNECRT